MHPLKFRAKVMQDGKPFLFYQNDQYLVSFLRRVTFMLKYGNATTLDDKDVLAYVHESYLGDHELEKCLEMWTGKIDIENKEVYNGDIVRATLRGGEPQFVTKVGIVKFGDYLKAFIVHFLDEDIDDSKPIGRFYEVEIIGSVYLNPELLK